MPLLVREGETEAQRERERERLIQGRAELEPEPMDTMLTHKLTCGQVGTYVWKILIPLISGTVEEETESFLHGGSFHPGTS